MLTVRGKNRIQTNRNIRSYRSCPTSTGVSMAHLDRERLGREALRLAQREQRRAWLAKSWEERPACSRELLERVPTP